EPVFVSPHDSSVLYTAAQFVLESSDQGRSWRRISADLTRNDKSKQRPSGGPITLDITSVEYYDTVFALAESPLQRGLLWAGTDDGLIHVTQDDGQSWHNVTPKDMPELSMVSMIDPAAQVPEVRLYRPQSAYHLHFPLEVNRRRPVGDNPPRGAVIDYFLKSRPAADEKITLEILDPQGKVLRTLSNHKKEKFAQPAEWPDREPPADLLPDAAGMNRFAWDLRVEDPREIPGAFYADEGPRG